MSLDGSKSMVTALSFSQRQTKKNIVEDVDFDDDSALIVNIEADLDVEVDVDVDVTVDIIFDVDVDDEVDVDVDGDENDSGDSDSSSSDDEWGEDGRECPYCLEPSWQALRTKHCHDCGKCVRRFDHHCGWLGTCVGEVRRRHAARSSS